MLSDTEGLGRDLPNVVESCKQEYIVNKNIYQSIVM